MAALMRPNNELLLMHDSLDDGMEQFMCAYEGCGRTYKHKRNLQIHVKADHAEPEDQTLYECGHDGCTRSFKYKCALNRHVMLTHSGPEIRETALAKRRKTNSGRIPASLRSERKFIVLTGEVPGELESKLYQCAYDGCTRVFTSKGSLSLHQERKHVNPNAFVCPIENCGRIFSYRHVMHTHVERVHHMEVDDPSVKKRRRAGKEIDGTVALDGEQGAMIDPTLIGKVSVASYLPSYLGADAADTDSEDDEGAAIVKNLSNITGAARKQVTAGGPAAPSTASRGPSGVGGIHALAALSAAAQQDGQDVYGGASLQQGNGGEGLFYCTVPGCSKTFPLKHVYQAHMRRVHNVDEK